MRLDDGLRERLERVTLLGAFAHDLGKCSDHFQQMVRGTRQQPQLIRHEACTLWLCWPGQPLSEWLSPAVANRDEYLLSLVSAVAHHRKFPRAACADVGSGAGTTLTLLTHHRDFIQTLELASRRFGLSHPPAIPEDVIIEASRRHHPDLQLAEWEREAQEAGIFAGAGGSLLALAKAIVIAADVGGSALPRSGHRPAWIGEALGRRAGRCELEEVFERRLGGKPLRPFQRAVAASTAPVVLVRAGCGTGKTAAAYAWAAARHPGRQLWITYPTTGTTTEGFRDYLDESDVRARLEHSRAEVDVEVFDLFQDGAEGRAFDRLSAIRGWGSEVIACTVDTVLGLVQAQRKGIYAWPGLSQSAVVFDEVHSYDEQLFGNLLRFLGALPGIPALLMTASLPRPRLAALREVVRAAQGIDLEEVPGPEDLERLPRYRLELGDSGWPAVEETISDGGKILWVSNTVDRCMATGRKAAESIAKTFIYHSRFRYLDRIERHREVVDGFRKPGSIFASTTQVAELSLDLSADLLVTDLAPIPALIQRLGRLNRRSVPEDPQPPKRCIVLPVGHSSPYRDTELSGSRRWVESLCGREVSQLDLVEAWGDYQEASVTHVIAAWLDGGWSTEPAAIREASPGITVILPDDARAVRQGRAIASAVDLPMPQPPSGLKWQRWPRLQCRFVPPAEAVEYEPTRGARWRAA